jgi:hypothetical protein
MNDLQLGPIPVRQHDLVRGNRDDAAAKLKRLLFGFHLERRGVGGQNARDQGVRRLAYRSATERGEQGSMARLRWLSARRP